MQRFLLFFLIVFTFLSADTTTNKTFFIDIVEVQYLEDETSTLSINDIIKQNFTKTSKNSFNLGYHKGTIWFRLNVKNNTEFEKFILTLNETFYETANLYYDYNGKIEKLSNSLFTPIQDREVKSNKLAFGIDLSPNKSKIIYLELKGKYAYFGKIELIEKDYFYFQESHGLNTFFTFVIGIVSVLIFFSFFLYSKTKEKLYLYYLGYTFFLLIYYSNISGLLVYIDLQKYIYDLHFSSSFMIGFLILFSKEYLQTQKYFNKLDKILTFIAIPFFIFGILVFYTYQPWNKFINNSSGLVCIFLIVVSIVMYFKGHREIKYYILAMVLYLGFVFLFTFMVNGVVEYNMVTRYGINIGVVLEMLLFSYLLSNRYHLSKQSVQNYLEAEVKNRTNELNVLLHERELLLREIYHRVKNNFHMIIGMLHLENEKESIDFRGLVNRVKSMSLIHEYLYMNKDLSNIAIDSYLEKLINNFKISYPKVTIQFKSDNILLNFDDALSLGIIINEVLTNSIKHNSDKTGLYIDIELTHRDNLVYLSIKDNGIGFESTKAKGLGLKLVNQFCKKLSNSHSEFSFENGTKFELSFSMRE